MIRRTLSVKDKKIILLLYNALARPHVEYSVQAWRPHFQGDIDLLMEGVQRRATSKLITSISNKSYEDRLHILNLTTLETRRLRAIGDLIEVFKIFKSFDNLDSSYSLVCFLNSMHTL